MAAGKMVLWNTTKVTGRARNITLYSKTIAPGRSREVDASWVHQFPHVLQQAITRREVHMGDTLPEWYHQALEDMRMKRITNKSRVPVVLTAEGKSPVKLDLDQHCDASDELTEALLEGREDLDDLRVEDLGEDATPVAPKEPVEDPVEPPTEPVEEDEVVEESADTEPAEPVADDGGKDTEPAKEKEVAAPKKQTAKEAAKAKAKKAKPKAKAKSKK